MLIVFSGTPGTGKTTLSRLLAQQLGAVYLRIDTMDQPIMNGSEYCRRADDICSPAGVDSE